MKWALQKIQNGDQNEKEKEYTVVVLGVQIDKQQQIDLDEICRKNGVLFVMAETKGLIGRLFIDFGDKFTINDVDGIEY